MENFSNQPIDTAQLPRFEQVPLTPLHPGYLKVLLLSWCIVFAVLLGAIAIGFAAVPEFRAVAFRLIAIACPAFLLVIGLSYVGFRKKAFAFRTHDVLYRFGILATTTTIIPYNRVQHVALHEGWLSRMFGLATVQVFTAGGSSGDISIPGIEKLQAENIRQLLMGKIQKEL